MTNSKFYLVTVVTLTCWVLSISCGANDSPILHMGGSSAPKGPHQTIRMESEVVKIKLMPKSYIVDAVFTFFNSGETTTEWVGFPKRGKGLSDHFDGTKDFVRFNTWVDGKEVQVTEEPDRVTEKRSWLQRLSSPVTNDYRWLVKRVTFPGNRTTSTRVRYEAEYYHVVDRVALYIYGTGRYWKGTIGKAKFIIDGTAIGGSKSFEVRQSVDTGFSAETVSEMKAEYEMNDFEPNPSETLEIIVDIKAIMKALN